MEQNKEHILDLRNVIAPVTFLKVTQELETLKPGQRMQILANDPDTRQELFKVLKPLHYELMSIKDESSFYRICLLRA